MIAWAMLAAAAVLVALLFVPVDLALSAGTRTGVRFRVQWLFGFVRIGDGSRPGGTRARPRRRPARRRRRRRATRTAPRLFAIEGLGARIAGLARDLSRALRWRGGFIALRAGLDDPADTGLLCGIVGCIRACLPASVVQIEFEPDFSGVGFDAQAEGSVQVSPARIVGALARFALSRPGRRAIGVMVWSPGR